MNWEQLLSLKRYGDTNKRLRIEQDETRLGFDVDYDRIIFSPEFRSLQDKTQVVPLSSTDFVHTRLTHSLEVSVVARSLGRRVGVKVLEKHPYLKEIHGYKANDFGAIVAAADYFQIPEIFIEKDYWVTYALHQLFHSEVKDLIVFKGGTSLSKCYSIIKRFSEENTKNT